MTRNQLLTLFFIGLLIFVFYQITLIFTPFLNAIFWAAILAFAFYPIYSYLRKTLKWKDTWVAMMMTSLIIFIVMPPVVFLIVNLTGQAIDLYQSVTSYIREGHFEHLIDRIRGLALVQKIETNLFQWEPLKENATTWLLNSSKNIANFTVAQAGIITKNIFILALNALIVCFLIFVFLRDGEKIYWFIYQMAPLEEENRLSIFTQINETFAAVIRGQLLTSLAQAITAGIIFWILGLPAPILLAVATFFATLVPIIGAIGIWLPVSIYLITVQAYWKAGLLFVLGIGVISFMDNIIKPALIGEKTKLPYSLLFFGILGGVKLYGIMGIFLGPLIISLFFVLVKIYQGKFSGPDETPGETA